MPGILNRESADPAGAGMDQDALAGARLDARKSLQRRQPHQRQRRGLRMRDGDGFSATNSCGSAICSANVPMVSREART